MAVPAVAYGAYELWLLAGATATYLQSPAGQAALQGTLEGIGRGIDAAADAVGSGADYLGEAAQSAWNSVFGESQPATMAQASAEAEAGAQANESESAATTDACSNCGGKEDKDKDKNKKDDPPKKKRVEKSDSGEEMRTPESHPEDFKELGHRKYQNKHTGEVWTRERVGRGHAGEGWDVTVRQRGSPGGRRVGEVRPDGTIGRKW